MQCNGETKDLVEALICDSPSTRHEQVLIETCENAPKVSPFFPTDVTHVRRRLVTLRIIHGRMLHATGVGRNKSGSVGYSQHEGPSCIYREWHSCAISQKELPIMEQ